MHHDDRARLGDLGLPIALSPAAAQAYAQLLGVSVATASRDLPRVLADARQSGEEAGLYRLRSRADRVDLTARVEVGGGRVLVHSLTARPYAPRKGGR